MAVGALLTAQYVLIHIVSLAMILTIILVKSVMELIIVEIVTLLGRFALHVKVGSIWILIIIHAFHVTALIIIAPYVVQMELDAMYVKLNTHFKIISPA